MTGENSLGVKIIHSAAVQPKFKRTSEAPSDRKQQQSTLAQSLPFEASIHSLSGSQCPGFPSCSHPRRLESRTKATKCDTTKIAAPISGKSKNPFVLGPAERERNLSAFDYLLSEQLKLLNECQEAQQRGAGLNPKTSSSDQWTWRRTESDTKAWQSEQLERKQKAEQNSLVKQSIAYRVLSGDQVSPDLDETRAFGGENSLFSFDTSSESCNEDDEMDPDVRTSKHTAGSIITKYKGEPLSRIRVT